MQHLGTKMLETKRIILRKITQEIEKADYVVNNLMAICNIL